MGNTPKIRFRGYTDEWERRKVTELGEIYIGLVTTMTAHYTDKGTLLIRNSDIKDSRFEFGENPIYLDEEFAKQNESRKHRIGDVITVHTGDIGTSAVITENEAGSIGFATIVTRPDTSKIISDFLCIYLNTDKHKNFALGISTGDGRNNYNLKEYYECVVPVPSIDEQKKIEDYINTLNHLITLHQRKCDDTKQLKKYMLQKMFPQKGQKNPEIRFAGFTDEWEQRKLEDIVEFLDNMRKPLEEAKRVSGSYPYYGASGIVDYVDDYIFDEELVLLSEDGANITDRNYPICFVVSGKYWVNNHAHVLKTKEGVDNNFLCMSLERKDYKQYNTGMAMPKLNQDVCRRIPVLCPVYEEQRKLGEYFNRLDSLITHHQRKCDDLKQLKQFMLQNMFV
jgi:type I restriction enzyme S subunit